MRVAAALLLAAMCEEPVAVELAPRPAPEGTVPREELLEKPPLTPELLREGATRYEVVCVGCHKTMPAAKSDTALHELIKNGDDKHAFADLTSEQRWAIVAFVRSRATP